MADNLVNGATVGIGQVLASLNAIRDDVDEARALINLMGWELPPGVDDIGLTTLDLGRFLEKLDVVIRATNEDWEDEIAMFVPISELVIEVNDLAQTIRVLAQELPVKFATFPDYVARTNIHLELPRRLFDFLLINFLARKFPRSFAVLHLLNIIDYPYFEADPDNFQVEHVRATINYHLFQTLFSDPAQLAEEAYGWSTPEFASTRFLMRLNKLFQTLGMTSRLQPLPSRAEEIWLDTTPSANEPASQLVTFIHEERGSIAGLRIGFSIFGARPTSEGATDGGLGIVPILRGTAEGTIPFFKYDDTFIDLSADGDLLRRLAMLLRPGQELEVRTGTGIDEAVTGRFTIGLRHGSSESDSKSLLSLPGGAGFQFQQVYLTGGMENFQESASESFMELGLLGCQLAFSLDGADGFVRQSISQEKMGTSFDLRIGWNSKSGIYFHGSSDLAISIPVHSQLGVFSLDSLTLELNADEDGIALESSVIGSLGLGPLLVTVKGLGLIVDVSFQDGNLGLFGLSPHFKPPRSIDLSINGGGFKGGGLLEFEPDEERYVGFLELEFKNKISLKAIGLLTTRLPGGSDGYSLLIIITAEFNPIQLGLGFTLNGVGGLLGLNRTANVERLRTGVKDNTLSSILFPQDIIANADRIISDLRQVFPPQNDRFIFGPMAKIGWGSPTLITIDVGLMIEVPSPVRLYLLGVIRAEIPNEEERKKQEEETGKRDNADTTAASQFSRGD